MANIFPSIFLGILVGLGVGYWRYLKWRKKLTDNATKALKNQKQKYFEEGKDRKMKEIDINSYLKNSKSTVQNSIPRSGEVVEPPLSKEVNNTTEDKTVDTSSK